VPRSQSNKPRLGTRIERGVKAILFGFLRIFIHVRKCTTVPRASVKNILVIRQHNQLGDMICVTPFLRALRTTYPDAYLALLAKPMNAEILRGSTFLDEVIVYDKARFFSAPFEVWRFAKTLKSRAFDLILVPSTVSMSVTSDVLAFFSGSKRRIGPASLDGKKNMTAFLYNATVALDWRDRPTIHQTQRNIDIASLLVLDDVSRELEIGLSEEELTEGETLIRENSGGREIVIGIHPGAAKIPNRWDALCFAEIANRCAEIYGAYIVVTAGPNDEEPLHEMMVNVPNKSLVLLNKPIRQVASAIAHCDLYVTNDTGMMHVAAATGTPTLALFGPTPPLQWAPPGDKHKFILGSDSDIHSITVEKVWAQIITRLDAFLAAKKTVRPGTTA
jgi:lipopolysaccharide heptosyltransferase II